MTDRELLELAAKAAGIKCDLEGPYVERPDQWAETVRVNWNPLDSDAEAFRLLVTLGMDAFFAPEDVEIIASQHERDGVCPWAIESWKLKQQDPIAATRRAIVRTAAAIGERMP